MRTTLFLLILLLAIAGCAGKGAGTNPDAANATDAAEASSPAEGVGEAEDTSIIDSVQLEPVGEMQLADGRVLEITDTIKIDKYYIYISGKLNGRSSTVMSLTRLDDLQRWKSIVFQDPHTFTIITRDDTQLRFTDARVFMGADSHDEYAFISTRLGSFQTEQATVLKRDVKAITIYQPQE